MEAIGASIGNTMKLPCVSLLDAKAWIRIPGQLSKMKYEKYLFSDFLLADSWILRVNKPAMKKFLKNLSSRVEVKL